MTEHKSGNKSSTNQGEGNREAAREYNEQQRQYVNEGHTGEDAEKAKKALESEEKQDLKKAEEEGKSHAKDFDPNVKRDR